ncbi:hypothetical protein N2152v2_009293 [Parachlorella kessleri]
MTWQGRARRQASKASRRWVHQRCLASSGQPSGEQESGGGGEGGGMPDSLPLAGVDTDWRAFRARLVSSSSSAKQAGAAPAAAGDEGAVWAHELPGPEPGCLLVAHPLLFTAAQTYFAQAVILIFAHDRNGSAGLILNRPSDYLIEQIEGTEALQPEFSKCRLYLGGDVGRDTLHLLHGVRGLEESAEVFKGVFVGGFPAARRGLASGKYTPDQFKVLTRYAGWGRGQLEEECRRGVWFPAAASSAFVLQHLSMPSRTQRAQKAKQRGQREGINLGGTLTESGVAMWHQIMELLGGDYAKLSAEMKDVYRADIMELPKDLGDSQV